MSNSPWSTSGSPAAATASNTPVSTAAATAAAQAAVDHLNSPDWLANADKIQLMNDWNAEKALQGSPSAVGSLDYQAAQYGVSSTSYDAAVTAIDTYLGTTLGYSTWKSTWPDGATINVTGIMTTLKGLWGTVSAARQILESAIGAGYVSTAATDALNKANGAILVSQPHLVSWAFGSEPALPNGSYPAGYFAITTDSRTEQVNSAGTAWVPIKTATAGLIGTIADAMISGLSASKVTGTLTDAQLAAISAAKVTGQITGTQISNGAVSTPQLAAGAVTAAQIAANTITAAQIAANTITTSQLAAGSVQAGQIAAGAVQAGNVAAGAIQAGDLAAGSVQAGNVAAQSITAQNLTLANFDNLIPNPNSEQAAPAGGWPSGAWEAAGLTSTNPYSGANCRTISSGVLYIGPRIQVIPGEQYFLSGYGEASTGNGYLACSMYDVSGNNIGPAPGYCTFPSSSYTAGSASFTVPANCFAIQPYIQAPSGYGFFDNFYLRRMADANIIVDGSVVASKIQATAVSTYGFAQATDSVNGGIYATAGAALVTNTATTPALITDKSGIKIGTRIFSDYWLRLLNALDGSAAGGYFVYRGNIDTTTRGGVPDISLLHIYGCGSVWDGAVSDARYEYEIRPSATLLPGTDNLENLSHIQMKCYTSSTSSLMMTRHVQLGFGRIFNAAAGANTANAHWGQFSLFSRLINFCSGTANQSSLWLRCQLFNAYGPSAERDYSPCSSEGAELGNSAISGTPSSGGGGGAGGGAGCPAPWVPITLASGLTIPAGSLSEGMEVIGVNDSTFEPAVGVVRDLQKRWVDKVSVVLEDGRAPEFTKTHRVATVNRGWQEVQNLIPGELIVAQKESRVKHVIHTGKGQVICFVVEGAHTYFSDDILSHNLKSPT